MRKVMWLAMLLVVPLLVSCIRFSNPAPYKKMLRAEFGEQLQYLDMTRLSPSEPFKSWQGVYALYLLDRSDNQTFMVRFTETDSPAQFLARVQADRAEKTAFVKRQQAYLERLLKLNLTGDFFSLAGEDLQDRDEWLVAYFADLSQLGQDRFFMSDASLKALAAALAQNRDPKPTIRIYDVSLKARYADVLKKHYHGINEPIGGERYTYRVSLADGGAVAYGIDNIVSPAPGIVEEKKTPLYDRCYQVIARQISENYFYRTYGVYISPLGFYLNDSVIRERIQEKLGTRPYFSFSLLDQLNGRNVVRGIVEYTDWKNGDGKQHVFEYTYFFADEKVVLQDLRATL